MDPSNHWLSPKSFLGIEPDAEATANQEYLLDDGSTAVQFGGVEGNRTPVRRRPYNDVYSLGCIGFNLEARHSQTPKARPNAFSSATPGQRLPLIVLI